ncbi:MAG: TIGR04013 family B12-binding domain/radical SAM domain-containing protein [Myxococcaceae bacterium]|nr:TIGR04013 family B12-binding domain/radical SAM domain-containing protein [Myxococcaceae bacterium]MCA3011101.1 TIGR04013 family B12-binding domain/radical SAM domain-containing protein [Myxococcaceae bacterium]
MVSLVASFRYPGQYALTALVGALDAHPEFDGLTIRLPRRTDELIATIRAEQARGHRVVVAWSFYSPSFAECADELRAVRASLDAPFLAIAGGVHATAEPRQMLDAGFDLVCIGEGERALPELLRRVRDGGDVAKAPGFARLDGQQVLRAPRPERVALDAFPPFSPRRGLFGAIELTRGCIYACRFCQTPFFSKATFRHRGVDDVARWARELRRSGRRDVRFISPTSLSYGSDDASVNLDAVEALLSKTAEAMAPDGRLFFGTFPSEVRPEHVTPEALALLKRFVANDALIIGGQSGSDRVLAESRRGHSVEAIVRAVRVAVAGGFRPDVDFILGLPGEAESDVAATVALMERLADLGARVHGHAFMPLPGTPFRDAAPARIDEATQAALDRLASRQALYGHWKRQLATAADIARRRDQLKSRG